MQVERTARYFTLGRVDSDVTQVLIALHGYGQSAKDFAKLFREFASPGTLFVFPEGLSRFYNRNRENQVGASWMTSDDRKAEIRDYVSYLNAVFQALLDAGLNESAPVTVLGFSQGTATASRWLAAGEVRADRLILWGGLPAFELLDDGFVDRLGGTEVILVTGTEDSYATPESLREAGSTLSQPDQPVRTIVFDGRHAIDSDTLADLLGTGT